jgi:hypothetical protein
MEVGWIWYLYNDGLRILLFDYQIPIDRRKHQIDALFK